MRNILSMVFAFLLLATITLNAADTKISALGALLEANIAADDELVIVDTSSTATNRITMAEFDKRYSTKDVADGNILVGDGSGIATSVNPSGDIDVSNAGVFSISADVIVSADINSAAAIAYSKLAALADGNLLIGSGSNVAVSVNPSGDVDVDNAGVFSLTAGAILDADVSSEADIAHSKMAALTASRALVSDGSGVVSVATTTSTEIGYVNGLSSAVQTQLDDKLKIVQAADALQSIGMLRATWEFAVDGGTGAIDLGKTFPDNAVIKYCTIEILTGMTSAGGNGTIAIHAEGANDILNAVDADTLSGFEASIQDWDVANFVKTTSARALIATVATEDLTAGKFLVNCLYSISD